MNKIGCGSLKKWKNLNTGCLKILRNYFCTVGMAQAVDYLLCKSEVLSSNPSLTRKKLIFRGDNGRLY
jgi:hypothetical protein